MNSVFVPTLPWLVDRKITQINLKMPLHCDNACLFWDKAYSIGTVLQTISLKEEIWSHHATHKAFSPIIRAMTPKLAAYDTAAFARNTSKASNISFDAKRNGLWFGEFPSSNPSLRDANLLCGWQIHWWKIATRPHRSELHLKSPSACISIETGILKFCNFTLSVVQQPDRTNQ